MASANEETTQIPKQGLEHQRQGNFLLPVAASVLFTGGLIYYCHESLSTTDVVFCVAFPLYLYLANAIRFDSNSLARSRTVLSLGLGQFLTTPGFKVYMIVFQLVSVIVPLALLALAPSSSSSSPAASNSNDDSSNVKTDELGLVQASIQPLVLLLVQVAVENATNSASWHHVPRILASIGFNSYRMIGLVEWVRVSYENATLLIMTSSSYSSYSYYYGMAALVAAVINLVVWMYNLFVFLLLRMLPLYLDERHSPFVNVEWRWYLFPVVVASDDDGGDKDKKRS